MTEQMLTFIPQAFINRTVSALLGNIFLFATGIEDTGSCETESKTLALRVCVHVALFSGSTADPAFRDTPPLFQLSFIMLE